MWILKKLGWDELTEAEDHIPGKVENSWGHFINNKLDVCALCNEKSVWYSDILWPCLEGQFYDYIILLTFEKYLSQEQNNSLSLYKVVMLNLQASHTQNFWQLQMIFS